MQKDRVFEFVRLLLSKDAPLERFARDVRVTSIYEGTSEIQRVIVGRHMLSV